MERDFDESYKCSTRFCESREPGRALIGIADSFPQLISNPHGSNPFIFRIDFLNGSLIAGMNDQLISVLAPDRDILHFEPRLVIALHPLEEEKRVQTDVLLFTIRKNQPGFEARSFVYFFAGAYELKGILPLVERNARRKAVELLLDYVERRHSQLGAPLATLRLTEASEEFPNWYASALLACPWNLRESFYDLRDRIHSKPLIELLDGAFEQTIVCRIE